MSQISVDVDLCRKDAACVAVCPSGYITRGVDGFPRENSGNTCICCGHCVAVCPSGALVNAGLPEEPMLPAWRQPPSPASLEGLMMTRRSVREFRNRPIPRELLESLLDVARRAPTAVNSQRLHWIATDDPAKVHALSAETIKWVRRSGMPTSRRLTESWDSGYDGILRGAPAVVVACAPDDYNWGVLDSAIALTYLELAAEARGLGVCWAGYLTRAVAVHAPLREALGLPRGYSVHGALMLGEPTFSYRRVPPRKPLSIQWL